MWPFPSVSDTHLTILLEQSRISLGLVSKTGKKIPFHLQAYQSFPLQEHEFAQAIVFNQTRLNKVIQDFLGPRQKIAQVTTIGVSGPQIYEKFVSISKTSDDVLSRELDDSSLVWEKHHLYEQDYDHDIYYYGGMTRGQIFQFQLFAINNTLELIALTTPLLGCIALLQEYYKDDFSKSRFGDKMMTQQNKITELITIDMLAALLHVDRVSFTDPHDFKRVGQLLGLSLVGDV